MGRCGRTEAAEARQTVIPKGGTPRFGVAVLAGCCTCRLPVWVGLGDCMHLDHPRVLGAGCPCVGGGGGKAAVGMALQRGGWGELFGYSPGGALRTAFHGAAPVPGLAPTPPPLPSKGRGGGQALGMCPDLWLNAPPCLSPGQAPLMYERFCVKHCRRRRGRDAKGQQQHP